MQENNQTPIPDDEIDLRSIFKKIGAFFSYLWWLLSSNIKTTLVFILVAVALSAAIKYSLPKTYKSSFIIRPTDIHEKFHVKILKDLQTLLRNQDYATLSDELKMDPKAISALADLDVTGSTFKAATDSINFTDVTLVVTDYNQFIPIQTALLNYLEQNPYFSRLNVLQHEQINLALMQVNKDLPQLDSLKSLQLKNYGSQSLQGQSALLMSELVDPASVYKMAIDRMTKKTNLLAQQVFDENFLLIKSCIVTKHHNWPPRILILCSVLVPCFVVLCLLFLHIKVRRGRGVS